MKITLLTMGRTDVEWVGKGLALYVSRLSHYVTFALEEVRELKGVSSLSQLQIKEREGNLLLSKLHPYDEVVLLDERGKEFRSMEFADMIRTRMCFGGKDLVFVIGGAYGFSDDVYRRADSMLSLSRMTFSHQMVRVIFVEQLYRAMTIIKGEPYHHE